MTSSSYGQSHELVLVGHGRVAERRLDASAVEGRTVGHDLRHGGIGRLRREPVALARQSIDVVTQRGGGAVGGMRALLEGPDRTYELRTRDRDRLRLDDGTAEPPRPPQRVEQEGDADLDERLEHAVRHEIQQRRPAGSGCARREDRDRLRRVRLQQPHRQHAVVGLVEKRVDEQVRCTHGDDGAGAETAFDQVCGVAVTEA